MPRLRRSVLPVRVLRFSFRVEKLARYGVDLNQHKVGHTEKLQLRVNTRTRGLGGILQICYRR